MSTFQLSKNEMNRMVNCLRGSNKLFTVTYVEDGEKRSFQSRYWSSPNPVPLDTAASYNFWELARPEANSRVHTVTAEQLTSVTVNGLEYVLIH